MYAITDSYKQPGASQKMYRYLKKQGIAYRTRKDPHYDGASVTWFFEDILTSKQKTEIVKICGALYEFD